MNKQISVVPTSSNIILLFLKSPRRGTVKTRLARDIGADQATAVYKALVERQIKALAGLGKNWEIHVLYTPHEDREVMQQWLGNDLSYRSQANGDLGQRLESACDYAFNDGAEGVYCIGGDCPSLNASDLLEARNHLENGADVAIGPCEDGGYYLLATRRFIPELFSGIPWSESKTLQATLKVTEAHQLSVSNLDKKYDIDQLCELQRAVKEGLLSNALLG